MSGSNRTAPSTARVTAATAILDRGWGKPTQSVEGHVEVTLERLIVMAIEREDQLTLVAPPLEESR